LIVSGSRGFIGALRWARAFKMLDDLWAKYPDMHIYCGEAREGADQMCKWWARNRGFVRRGKYTGFPVTRADWEQHGKAAGILRNCKMAAAGATHVLAFWDGTSPGTAHMIAEGTRRFGEKHVHVVKYEEWK